MRYFLVISYLLLALPQNESKIVRSRIISDRRSDDSLNINVSAGYGVETENSIAPDILKISKSENVAPKEPDSQKISTVYAIQVEPTPTSNSQSTTEMKITQTVPDSKQESSDIFVLQSSQNDPSRQRDQVPIQSENSNHQTPILPEKEFVQIPEEVHFRPAFVQDDRPHAEPLVSLENNHHAETPPIHFQENSIQSENDEKNSHQFYKFEPQTVDHFQTTQQPFTANENFLRNHQLEYRPSEDDFRQNEPQFQHSFNSAPTQSYQVQEEFDESEKIRPNLHQLQNIVTKLEGSERHQPAKVVQVLKVPAVYEIHLQSEDMPSLGKDMFSFSDHPKFLAESTQVRTKFQNGPLTFQNNLGDNQNYYENKYITKPQLLRAQQLNKLMRNQYNNKYLNSGRPMMNRHPRPAAMMDFYHFKEPSMDRPPSYSQVSIKQQYNHQPTSESLPVPLKLSSSPAVKYATAFQDTKFVHTPQATAEHLPIPLKLASNGPLKHPSPQIHHDNKHSSHEGVNFDFLAHNNYIDDYKKPQALHIVPAPVLSSSTRPNQVPHSTVYINEKKPVYSSVPHTYAAVKPVEEPVKEEISYHSVNQDAPSYHSATQDASSYHNANQDATSYHNVNHYTTQPPDDLIYGKQKETVAAPAPTHPTYSMQRPMKSRRPNIQSYYDVTLPEYNNKVRGYSHQNRHRGYKKYSPSSRSYDFLNNFNTPLGLFYLDPKKIKKSSDVEPYYVEDRMEGEPGDDLVLDNAVENDEENEQEGNDDAGYSVNEYNNEEVEDYPKWNPRQSKKSNLMDYVIYITERTVDDDDDD